MNGTRAIIVAASLTVAGFVLAPAAGAQTDPYPGGDQIGTNVEATPPSNGDVIGNTGNTGETGGIGGSLPVTGGDLVGLVAIGGGAIALGTIMVRRSRTERPAQA